MAPPLPINKKYLCAAPRPENWDFLADTVLKNLGSDRQERETNLRTSIAAARTMHQDAIKATVGPGRKSNAEHAIAFYEFLLDLLVHGWDADGAMEVHTVAEQDADTVVAEPTTNSYVEANRESQPPRPKHNDLCEVCEEPKSDDSIVLGCSTCPRIFHPSCHRPEEELKELQGDDWKCSYCVLASEPKTTKARRVSAAGVRLMARLRNQHIRKRHDGKSDSIAGMTGGSIEDEALTGNYDNDNEDDDIDLEDMRESDERALGNDSRNSKRADEKPFADGGTQKTCFVGENVSAKELLVEPGASTRNADTYAARSNGRQTGDDCQEIKKGQAKLDIDSIEVDGGRGKRNRKQPTLFDPQTVPASAWVSDEVQHQSNKNDSASESSPSSSAGSTVQGKTNLSSEAIRDIQLDRRAKAKKKRDGSSEGVWCNFCLDDPAIPLCCFCACRYCFGKQEQDKVLLCDLCHDEYHSFCLNPPVATVSPTEAWYCPPCQASREKRVARAASKRRVAIKRRDDDSIESAHRESSPRRIVSASKIASGDKTAEKPVTGRPRGRPKKNTPTVAQSKKRGRPSKSISEPPRKRGRPPKFESLSPNVGRSSSSGKRSVSSMESMEGSVWPRTKIRSSDLGACSEFEYESAALDPVTISRSGRTVKRSSFHDEIGQGEQHLRSYREQQRRLEAGLMRSSSGDFSVLTATKSGPTSLDGDFVTDVAIAPLYSPSGLKVPPPTPASTPFASSQVMADNQAPSVVDTLSAAASSLVNSFDTAAALTGPPVSDFVEKERVPRRKPGARECMQMSRRFGAHVIPQSQMETLLDYCQRGKVEHLIRMRERLDDHARYLETQLAGLESLVKEKGESDVVVPTANPVEDEPRNS